MPVLLLEVFSGRCLIFCHVLLDFKLGCLSRNLLGPARHVLSRDKGFFECLPP